MLNHLQLVMPRRHTMQERVFIVKNYCHTGNYREVVRRFEDTYGRSIDRIRRDSNPLGKSTKKDMIDHLVKTTMNK